MYTSPHHEMHCSQKGPGASMVGNTLSSTGVFGTYAPMYQPVKVLAVALVITAISVITNAPVVEVYRRPTAGANANRVLYCRFANPVADWVGGNVLFYDDTSILLSPGEEIMFENIVAGNTGNAHRLLYAEPVWENPVNNPHMIRSL